MTIKTCIRRALLCAGVIAYLANAEVRAATLTFESDLDNEFNSATIFNVVVASPNPAWAAAPWISHKSTDPANGTVVSFFEYFTLSASDSLIGSVTVWADDTADVRLNGVLLYAANPLQDAHCAAGPIGCQPNESVTLDLSGSLRQGYNLLKVTARQVDGGPFGVAYSGIAGSVDDPAPTPEPASMLLTGCAIVLGVARRIRRSS
jgi:hypothetical protein